MAFPEHHQVSLEAYHTQTKSTDYFILQYKFLPLLFMFNLESLDAVHTMVSDLYSTEAVDSSGREKAASRREARGVESRKLTPLTGGCVKQVAHIAVRFKEASQSKESLLESTETRDVNIPQHS